VQTSGYAKPKNIFRRQSLILKSSVGVSKGQNIRDEAVHELIVAVHHKFNFVLSGSAGVLIYKIR
jgi:hypothetical protein